jgi:hypothetical protein
MEVFTTFFVYIKSWREKMPKRQLKTTKTEYQENRARLLRLKEMGIPTGSVCGASPEPDRLTVEQTEDECAWIYELPSGGVAFVGPAELTVRVPGTLITYAQVAIPDFDCELELSDPGESLWYAQLMNLLPYNLTECLNDRLTSGVPLSVRQVRGAIIAEGWASVPAKLHAYAVASVELFLWGAQKGNDFRFNFRARLNRDLMREYEQRQLQHRERMRSTKRSGLYGPARSGLFGPARGQVGNPKSVSPKEAINLRDANGEDDRELRKPN